MILGIEAEIEARMRFYTVLIFFFFFFFFDRYFIAVEDNKILPLNVPDR